MSLFLQAAKTSSFRWAVGSWSFFIAENLVLSENRSFLIESIGDDNYHYLYGLISTAACGSITYAYFYKISSPLLLAWPLTASAPLSMKGASFIFHTLGLGMLSQIPPKLQMPILYEPTTTNINNNNNRNTGLTVQDSNEEGTDGSIQRNSSAEKDAPVSKKWKVRCPFDFTDTRSATAWKNDLNDDDNHGIPIVGIDRISRHPGLWSMGLIGLGQACLNPSMAHRAWLSMPIFVAAIGGWHTDSRYRRGMGGNLNAQLDQQTSNIPFAAALFQQNGNVVENFKIIYNECKGINLGFAVSAAAIIVLRKGKGRFTYTT